MDYLLAQRGAPNGGMAPRLQPTVLEEGPAVAPDMRAVEALGEELDGLALRLSGDLDAALAEIAKEVAQSPLHWEVVYSQQFRKNWRQHDTVLQEIALQLVIMIVRGRDERSHVNHAKPLEYAVQGLGLFESYMGRRGPGKAYRLIWEEVWAWSNRYECWRDKIVLWGISHHDKVKTLVSFISERFRARRMSCDAERPTPPERRSVTGDVRRPRERRAAPPPSKHAFELPDTFDVATLDISPADGGEPGCASDSQASRTLAIEDLVMLTRVRERAEELATGELAGRAASAVAGHSDPNLRARVAESIERELEIICAKGPVVVIGRSGTGKTACAGARLWSLHHAYFSLSEGSALFPSGHLRCVYITTNEALLRNVRRDFTNLEPEHMLLAPERDRALAPAGGSAGQLGSGDADLAKAASFASVRSEMYPLFLTGRKWLRLLDGTLRDKFFSEARDKFTEVKYEAFHAEFWTTLQKKKRDKLPHARIVWTEFMSLISGSAESLLAKKDYLDLKDYLAMGAERSRVANDTQRKETWELYDVYRQWKRSEKHYDIPDVVRHMFKEIAKNGYLGPPLHEIIVDEVQDFTGAELGLIAFVIADRSGLFFCGDTCQTVARGLAFRISDLGSMLYHFFGAGAAAAPQPDPLAVPGREADSRLKKKKDGGSSQLETMELYLNYRSHDGILSCATVCVNLLEVLFPKEIDKLPPDQGLGPGPKPCLLRASDQDSLKSFLFGSTTGPMGLGPNQVAIVREVGKRRDKERRQQLEALFGESIWLTVEEAKGLEFEEVLLFNFFADGPGPDDEGAAEQLAAELMQRSEAARARMWQEAVDEAARATAQGLTGRAKGKGKGGPFDPYANRLVATELKELYTSLTRAKGVVWIYDEHESVRSPMFNLFVEKGVVEEVQKEGGRTGEALARAGGTQEQWADRAVKFLEQSLFEKAVVAFRKAGDMRSATFAQAKHELAIAELERTGPGWTQHQLKAAELFLEIGLKEEAADCYLRAGDRGRARATGGLEWCRAQALRELESSREPPALVALAEELLEDFARASGDEQERLENECTAARAKLLSRAAAIGLERPSDEFDLSKVEASVRAAIDLYSSIGKNHARLAGSQQAYCTLCRFLERAARYEEALECAERTAEEFPDHGHGEIAKLRTWLCGSITAFARNLPKGDRRRDLLERAAAVYLKIGRGSDAADCYLLAGDRDRARATGGLEWCLAQAPRELESSRDPPALVALAEELLEDFSRASGDEQERFEKEWKAARAKLLSRAAAIGLERPSDEFSLSNVEASARAAIDLFKDLDNSTGMQPAYCTLCRCLEQAKRYEEAFEASRQALEHLADDAEIVNLCKSLCSSTRVLQESERKRDLLKRAAAAYLRIGLAFDAADCFLAAGDREAARAAGGLQWSHRGAGALLEGSAAPQALADAAYALGDDRRAARDRRDPGATDRALDECRNTEAQLLLRAAEHGARPQDDQSLATAAKYARDAVGVALGLPAQYGETLRKAQLQLFWIQKAANQLGEGLLVLREAQQRFPDDKQIIEELSTLSRSIAERRPAGPERDRLYLEAATLFERRDLKEDAAKCYMMAGNRLRARQAGGLPWIFENVLKELAKSAATPSGGLHLELAQELYEGLTAARTRKGKQAATALEIDSIATLIGIVKRAAPATLVRLPENSALLEKLAHGAFELSAALPATNGDAKGDAVWVYCRVLDLAGRYERALSVVREALDTKRISMQHQKTVPFLAGLNRLAGERAPPGPERNQYFKEAARHYESLGESAVAADCLLQAGDLKRASSVGGLRWSLSKAGDVLRESDPAKLAAFAEGMQDAVGAGASSADARLVEEGRATRVKLLNRAVELGLAMPQSRPPLRKWIQDATETCAALGEGHSARTPLARETLELARAVDAVAPAPAAPRAPVQIGGAFQGDPRRTGLRIRCGVRVSDIASEETPVMAEFAVSTGSERTAISRRVADAAGLEYGPPVPVRSRFGGSGTQERVAMADLFFWDDAFFRNERPYRVHELPMEVLVVENLVVDGMLGADALKMLRARIDLAGGRLVAYPPPYNQAIVMSGLRN